MSKFKEGQLIRFARMEEKDYKHMSLEEKNKYKNALGKTFKVLKVSDDYSFGSWDYHVGSDIVLLEHEVDEVKLGKLTIKELLQT